VADAGGSFIVTPNVDPRVLTAARERQLVTLPGAFTPSEVALADECGADFVKLFPAATGGVGHLAALRGPFPNVRFVPTGGVSEANAADWFAAGAVAVAMGSNIVTADASLEGLFERAQRAVRACES
jgi:2-dehydro-3-deoxyphosphogluconate aldolase/(4S)-4-hydroxy-2-oxoglutarate aldolase